MTTAPEPAKLSVGRDKLAPVVLGVITNVVTEAFSALAAPWRLVVAGGLGIIYWVLVSRRSSRSGRHRHPRGGGP